MTGASNHLDESTERVDPNEPPDPAVEPVTIEVEPVAIEHVRWSEPIPQLRNPTLITAFEGWNDAGDAATMAARHLIVRWGCKTVAEIDPEFFYDFTTTRPTVHLSKQQGDEQQRRILKWPSNKMKAVRLPQAESDVVVLIGIEPQLRWRTFCDQVIAVADVLGVKNVVALGALLAEVPHSRPVEVYGTTTDETLRTELHLAKSTYEGPTGIVGVLTAACRDAGRPTASFWAAVPAYMPGAPSPKAALALVKRVCTLVGAPVASVDLNRAAVAYEREIDKLVANDEDTVTYVSKLEQTWDADQSHRDALPNNDQTPLENDPATLVAEVEQFLREAD